MVIKPIVGVDMSFIRMFDYQNIFVRQCWIHPWNLTWPLKIGNPKRKLIFQPSFFRGYVKFRGCSLTSCYIAKVQHLLFQDCRWTLWVNDNTCVRPDVVDAGSGNLDACFYVYLWIYLNIYTWYIQPFLRSKRKQSFGNLIEEQYNSTCNLI